MSGPRRRHGPARAPLPPLLPALVASVLVLALTWPAMAGAGPDGAAGAAAVAGASAADTAAADSLGADPPAARYGPPAAADSLVAAADSLAGAAPAEGADPGLQQMLAVEAPLPPEASTPLLLSWQRTPTAGISADMRRVEYSGDLSSLMLLEGNATFQQSAYVATEDHRQIDKTIDKRGGQILFEDGDTLPVDANVMMNWDWSEDRTFNTAGTLNTMSRDYKRAQLDLAKEGVRTGPVAHNLRLGAQIEDQKGETFLQRTDYTDAKLAAGLNSFLEPAPGVRVKTLAFERRSDGERVLGDQTSPSSATEDSLGGRLRYERGVLAGSFEVVRTSLERSYLDWRRNTTGLVDTARVAPSEKIVEELEQSDVVSLNWSNDVVLGPLTASIDLRRQMDETSYRFSGVGSTERQRHLAAGDLWYRGRRDTLSVGYSFEERWDDQTIQGSDQRRGRQTRDQYDFGVAASHRLFRRTSVQVTYDEKLSQDVAENQYNDNDRDRLEQAGTARLVCDMAPPFRTSLIFSARHIEDLSIRRSRSANSSYKDVYELAPIYRWRLAPWLELHQTYRLAIEYNDYIFSGLENVRREDDYNKRGNLTTRVYLRPSPRLRVTVQHDYSERFNATRTNTDAAGDDYYRRDLEQSINTIDFSLEYEATSWLKLMGATDLTRDEKNFISRDSLLDQRSGGVQVGGVVKLESRDKARSLDARVSRLFAYGPSVQEVNERYWQADASFSWRF